MSWLSQHILRVFSAAASASTFPAGHLCITFVSRILIFLFANDEPSVAKRNIKTRDIYVIHSAPSSPCPISLIAACFVSLAALISPCQRQHLSSSTGSEVLSVLGATVSRMDRNEEDVPARMQTRHPFINTSLDFFFGAWLEPR